MLADFAELNRRRIFGGPVLEVEEVAKLARVRSRLEAHFATQGSSAWRGLERRDFSRLPARFLVHFGIQQPLVGGKVENISEGGLFIATPHPLEAGSLLQLVLADDGDDPLELRARVTWRRSDPCAQGPAGMGVAFIGLGPSQRRRIERILQRSTQDSA
jgi:uncharacterized protein (TIGR02266 family)